MTEEKLKGMLYLYVILPLIEEVINSDEKKQKGIKKWNCVVQFQVKEEKDMCVHFKFSGGEITIVRDYHPNPTLTIIFKDIKFLIDFFSGKLSLPSIKGWWHIILLIKIFMLLNTLNMLKPSYEAKTPEEKKLKVKMLLRSVLYSLEILSKEDEYIKNVIAGAQNKVVQWIVKPDGPYMYANFDRSGIKPQKGIYDKRAYSTMEFSSIDAAYDILTEKTGTLDAFAKNLLFIKGAAEFAVKAGLCMQRVGEYLKP